VSVACVLDSTSVCRELNIVYQCLSRTCYNLPVSVTYVMESTRVRDVLKGVY
jgi:hypothetical protein